jgi:aminoacyl tRNA synthase complex-interacting multifunctional protein 1
MWVLTAPAAASCSYTNAHMDEINPKRKILERLFPDLKTSEDGTPTYKGVPFMTSKGPVVSTLPNGSVA